MCPREKLKRAKAVMPTSLFKEVLNKVQADTSQYGYVTFAGFGEPLMDRELLSKIEIARNRGFRVLLLTNGSLLDLNVFNAMDGLGVDSVRVSFYGMNARTYGKMHGVKDPDTFYRVWQALNEICSAGRRTKLVMTLNVVDGINDGDTDAWIKYWEARADLIEVWRPHNWVYGRKFRPISAEKRRTCARPFTGPLQIQVDGTVNMCCFDFNGDLTLGDLRRNGLKDIFKGPMFRKIYEIHNNGNMEQSNLICKDCDQLNRDKSNVIIYNSHFDAKERVECISTTYNRLGFDAVDTR